MLSRLWDVTTPLDTELAGEGDDEIRALKSELKEHLEQDHHMAGVLDPLQGNCDGYHNKITFYPLEADPVPLTGTGIEYTKVVNGVQELHYIESTNNTPVQITKNGELNFEAVPHYYFSGKLYRNTNYDYYYDLIRVTADWSKTITVLKRVLMLFEFGMILNSNTPRPQGFRSGYYKLTNAFNSNELFNEPFVNFNYTELTSRNCDSANSRAQRRDIVYLEPGTYTLSYIYPQCYMNNVGYTYSDVNIRFKAIFAFDDTLADAYTVS